MRKIKKTVRTCNPTIHAMADKIAKKQVKKILAEVFSVDGELAEYYFEEALRLMYKKMKPDNDDVWDNAQTEMYIAFQRIVKEINYYILKK